MRRSIPFGLVWLAALALAPLACAPEKTELPVVLETVGSPYQEFANATLLSYQGGVRKWKLQSEYMRKPLGDTGLIVVVPVVLSLYDSAGHPSSKVLSDSGTTTPAMRSFTIWGDVYVRTKEGLVVRTERLALNNDTHTWHSDTLVELRSAKGDVLRGKGFDASEDFSRSSFQHSVSGWFPQFRERVEKDEGLF